MILITAGVGGSALSAAGQVQHSDTASAGEDVPVDNTAVTQEIEFTVTLEDASTSQIAVDLSALAAEGAVSRVEHVSVTGTDVVAEGDGNIDSAGVHTFSIAKNGTSSGSTTAEVTVRYEHDTSALSPAAVGDVSVPIESADGSFTETVTFDLVYDTETVARSPETDIAFNGTSVYAGEDDVTFIDTDGRDVARSSLSKTAGSSEGTPLQLDVADDSRFGTYAENQGEGSGNFRVLLQEPRITTAEIRSNGSDEDITTISSRSDSLSNLVIKAEWNFPEAEALEVTVIDPSGSDITDEVVASPVLNERDGEGRTDLDLQGEDSGEYTIEFEGTDGLGTAEYSLEVLDAEEFGITTGSENTTQGNTANFTITGGSNNRYHLVTVDTSEFREDVNTDEQLFRNVEDTASVGYATADGVTSETAGLDTVNASTAAYAYAVVRIDQAEATGEIDTALLTDKSVTINVYASSESGGDYYNPRAGGIEVLDTTDFDVIEGSVTLDRPTTQYTIGQPVDVAGEASGADAVRIYAYDGGQWLPVEVDDSTTINVDDENTFRAEEIVLSAGNRSGNDVLSFEGQYRIGVIDAAAVTPVLTNGDGTTGAIAAPEFSSAVSDQHRFTTEVGQLTADITTYNNQIAETDGMVSVSGIAPTDTVVIVFTDKRGNTVIREVSADTDPINLANIYAQDEISLRPLTRGPVTVAVISPGRDEVFGDGTRVSDGSDLRAYLTENAHGDGTQVRDYLASVTTGVNSSDDQVVTEQFRLTDSRVSIDRVGPVFQSETGVSPVEPGDTLLIEGQTNRNPTNAALTVELTTADFETVATTIVKEWDNSGSYRTTFDTSGLEPGSYTVTVGDLQTTDRVTFNVVSERTDSGNDSEQRTPAEPAEQSDRNQSAPQTQSSEDSQQEQEPEQTTADTQETVPGFGALASVVALIVMVALARLSPR